MKNILPFALPVLSALVITVATHQLSSVLSPFAISAGCVAMFLLGLTVKTRGERLIIQTLEELKADVEKLK